MTQITSRNIPPDISDPKVKPVRITTFLNEDHANDLETRWSITIVIMFINKNPIQWYNRLYINAKTSTYGSELVAKKTATKLTMEICYKLIMMGVPFDGPAKILGDNESVVISCSNPSSNLDKKHNYIYYHWFRGYVAAGVISLAHIPGKYNQTEILTKNLDI